MCENIYLWRLWLLLNLRNFPLQFISAVGSVGSVCGWTPFWVGAGNFTGVTSQSLWRWPLDSVSAAHTVQSCCLPQNGMNGLSSTRQFLKCLIVHFLFEKRKVQQPHVDDEKSRATRVEPLRLSDAYIDMSNIKHEEECFIRYPNAEKRVEKTRRSRVFFNQLRVFDIAPQRINNC